MENDQTLIHRYSIREELTAMQAFKLADKAQAEGRDHDATRLIELGYHMLSYGVNLDGLRSCGAPVIQIMRQIPR